MYDVYFQEFCPFPPSLSTFGLTYVPYRINATSHILCLLLDKPPLAPLPLNADVINGNPLTFFNALCKAVVEPPH